MSISELVDGFHKRGAPLSTLQDLALKLSISLIDFVADRALELSSNRNVFLCSILPLWSVLLGFSRQRKRSLQP